MGIEIGENRNGVLEQNADDGAHIGDRRGDDLIAGRHTADAERHMHSRRAGGRRHTVRHIVDFREFLREGFDFIAVPVKQRSLFQRFFQVMQVVFTEAIARAKRRGL